MSILSIDLGAVRANYRAIQARVGAGCTVSGVVKANAYGLGVGPVSKALYEEGCRLFFVATLPEALELRLIVGDAPVIAMLNGYDASQAPLYKESKITPVLNHEGELTAYQNAAQDHKPAILHFDTGMNRLGFEADAVQRLADDSDALSGLDVLYVMSHFACSDESAHAMNAAQVESFLRLASLFRGVPKSMCNSGGIYQNADWHLDMVRPGMALYGLNPCPYQDNPMRAVLSLETLILQIKSAHKDETCGYNATYRFEENTMLAIVSLGYADGILRSLSNKGALYWKGIRCPIRGRVSMDLTIVDLSAVPDSVMPRPGDALEVIGPHQSADDLARDAGSIGYEILTSLSRRYQRVYVS